MGGSLGREEIYEDSSLSSKIKALKEYATGVLLVT
jgi:hypothetical protein